MTHIESIKKLQNELVDKVIQAMKTSELHMVEFKTPFRVFIEEQTFDGDYIMVPLLARYLYDDGTLGTEDGDYILKDLTIYEIAYILDVLEAGEFTVDDDEFIDPAGGRGLQSHI